MRTRALANALAAMGLFMSLIGCAPGDGADAPAGPSPTNSAATEGPGAVVDSTPMADVDRTVADLGGQSIRISYRSTSGATGAMTTVTGAAFLPPGKAPHGGWPVVAFAHGTFGINPDCSPSRSPDLLKSIGLVSIFLQLGFAVAAPDYQGLGGPGPHPFLDAKTGGMNLIDAVRALRTVFPDVSTRWGALGESQGGAVSWAANEQAATYAPELNLVGAVALAPLANVTGLVDKALKSTMTSEQEGIYVWTLMGLERTRPGFPVDDFRRGSATANWSQLSQCAGAGATERNRVLTSLDPADLTPSSLAAAERLRRIFAAMGLPQQRAAAPMLVLYGGRDAYVDAEWTRQAVYRACELGSRIAAVYQPEKGDDDLDPAVFSGWLMSRFEGLPAPSTC